MSTPSWMSLATRAHLRSRRVAVWAVILATTAAALAFVPLFDVLGYEFSFALGLVASLAGADCGAAFARQLRAVTRDGLDRALPPGRLVAAAYGRAAAATALILIPPLAIIALNAARVRQCDWWFGLETYLGLTVTSALLATAAGLIAGLAAGGRRFWSNALPYAIVIGAWIWHVTRFYVDPPVFAYAAFGGYFPGNLYDESIDLTAAFYAARLFHALVATAALAVVALLLDVPTLALRPRGPRRPIGWRLRPAIVAVTGAVCAAILFSSAAEIGFSIDVDDLRAEFNGRYETDHFVIYYPLGGEIEDDIDLIARDHEFRYAQATSRLGAEPDGKIHSYYFRDAFQKRRWFGALNVHMAKPWRREIFLNHQAFPHPVLRHEIAHIVAGAFGDPVFGVSAKRVLGVPVMVNVGLVEGTAVAADWPDDRGDLTPHEAVRAMRELGFEPPIERLFSTGFFAFSGARSYTTAGSFVRHLIEQYGTERFHVLYRTGGDFDRAYGRSLSELTNEWRKMIDDIALAPEIAEKVRERFRRPSIFGRPCPHAIAAKREEIARLMGRGERDEAVALARQVCKDAAGEPRYELDLARLLAADRRIDDARDAYRDIAANEEYSSQIRAEALIALADLAGRWGPHEAVRGFLTAADALPIEDETRRQIVARRLVLDHTGPAREPLWAYFWGEGPGEDPDWVVLAARAGAALAAEPELPLAHYLLGRLLTLRNAPDDAVFHLRRAGELGLPHPLLERENARLLATAAYVAGEPALVRDAARVLMAPEQPAIVQWLGRDWLERLDWDAATAP